MGKIIEINQQDDGRIFIHFRTTTASRLFLDLCVEYGITGFQMHLDTQWVSN
jgi:hypothetical protein